MLHWGDCLGVLEAISPQAAGGTNLDETLRSSLVPFANTVMEEVSREQRWFNSLIHTGFATVAGTQSYSFQTGSPAYMTAIKRVFWRDANARPHPLELMDRMELRRVYNDATGTANRGAPLKYAYEFNESQNRQELILYPTPDGNGPASGNYDIVVEAYSKLNSIVETTGTTAASTTLTVPDTTYLTSRGLSASEPFSGLIVRDAGSAQSASVRDWHLATGWTAFPGATTVTMTGSAPAAGVVTTKQTYFRATNWLITHWPQVLIFGTLREVASYWGNEASYQKWEVRFHDQLERLQKYEFDMRRSSDVSAVAQVGQYAPTLRRLETNTSYDVRGGS